MRIKKVMGEQVITDDLDNERTTCTDCYVEGAAAWNPIVLCRIHAAAPALLSALEAMLTRFERDFVHESTKVVTDQARAALRLAKEE